MRECKAETQGAAAGHKMTLAHTHTGTIRRTRRVAAALRHAALTASRRQQPRGA